MTKTQAKSGWTGRLIGLVLLAAGIIAVFFIDWSTEAPAEPTAVRPLKTMVIEAPFSSTGRKVPRQGQARPGNGAGVSGGWKTD